MATTTVEMNLTLYYMCNMCIDCMYVHVYSQYVCIMHVQYIAI